MHRSEPTRWLLSLIALVLLAGCSRGPESVAPTSPATTAGGPVFLATPPAPVAAPQGLTFAVKFIRADQGGDLELGNLSISFPKGSLPFSTWVSISTLGDGLVGFHVQPADLVLLKPALVTIEQIDHTNEKALPGLRAHLQRQSGTLSLETRRNGNTIEGDTPSLGEFRIGSEGGASTVIQVATSAPANSLRSA